MQWEKTRGQFVPKLFLSEPGFSNIVLCQQKCFYCTFENFAVNNTPTAKTVANHNCDFVMLYPLLYLDNCLVCDILGPRLRNIW